MSDRLNAHEKKELDERGFVLRREVFEPREIREICDACEDLVQRLLAAQRRTKLAAGS